jgi:hypothetical protein
MSPNSISTIAPSAFDAAAGCERSRPPPLAGAPFDLPHYFEQSCRSRPRAAATQAVGLGRRSEDACRQSLRSQGLRSPGQESVHFVAGNEFVGERPTVLAICHDH